MIPRKVTLSPLYNLIGEVGLIDTYAAMIVPYLFNALRFHAAAFFLDSA